MQFSLPAPISQAARIAIYGFGREGQNTLRFLQAHLPESEVLVVDQRELTEFDETAQQLLELAQVQTQLGRPAAVADFDDCDVIFYTPGISPYQSPRRDLEAQQDIYHTSNSELFLQITEQLEHVTTIGITGTKGKSTTTSLMHHILESSDKRSLLGGNIGIPALDLATDALASDEESFAVLELSCHQTRSLRISPDVAVLQTMTPEHLDYYPDVATYYQAKYDLLAHQDENDLLIYCADSPVVVDGIEQSSARKLAITVEAAEADSAVGAVVEGAFVVGGETVCAVEELGLRGAHNQLNALPGIVFAKEIGISDKQISAALQSFDSLPHRLERVAEVDGVLYINDSAGTTPESCMAALEAFADRPIVLLAGGSEKGVDFSELAERIVNSDVKKLILFPPTGVKIARAVTAAGGDNLVDAAEQIESMEAAFIAVQDAVGAGDVVLLSPACASFGVFENYRDRGQQFRDAVAQLQE